MRELDDATLELQLRHTLREHLGSVPLTLTAEALERRRVVRDQARRRRRIVLGLGLAAALILPVGWLAAGAPLPRPTDATVAMDVSSETPAARADRRTDVERADVERVSGARSSERRA